MLNHLSSDFTHVTMRNMASDPSNRAAVGAAAKPLPRRERARAATIEEIKQTALDLMREQGGTEVRFTDIARQMGMTPPALYRYFADRDELLTALITDAYDALAAFIAEQRDALPARDVAGRWLAAAQAYRAWARQEPQQFALILGLPLPGYAAPQEGPTTEAASRAMAQLSALFVDAAKGGRLRKPLLREVHPAVAECAEAEAEEMGAPLPPETFQAMLHTWAALHGFTSLEAYGHLEWMTAEARNALFVGQMRLAARTAGLPVPA
jgi:AcrR family transcriptional regulator